MPRTDSFRRHLATLVLVVAGGAQAPAAPRPLDTRACQVSTVRETEQRRPGPQQQANQAPNDIQEAISDMADPGISQAVELMESYAQRTGLTADQAPRRYLWTDAFAVCNFIGLARATGDQRFLQLALRLVASEEGLAAEEALPDKRDLALDVRFARGHARRSRVDDEAAVTAVLLEDPIEHRIVAVGLADRGPQVIDHDPSRHAAEELPAVLEPADDVLQLLRMSHVDVLVTAVDQGDDQGPQDPTTPE